MRIVSRWVSPWTRAIIRSCSAGVVTVMRAPPFAKIPSIQLSHRSPRARAQDDVLAGEGGAIRAEEGVAADRPPPAVAVEHLPDRLFLQRREVHQERVLRQMRSDLADDVEGRRDGDGHDDDPAALPRAPGGASPSFFPDTWTGIPLPGEEGGEPFADSSRPADDADLQNPSWL